MRRQRLAGWHQAIQRASRAAEDIAQDVGGGEIAILQAGHAIGDSQQADREIGRQRQCLRLHRPSADRRMPGHVTPGDVVERGANLRQRLAWLHVAGDHQDGVVWRVPCFVEAPQQGGVGLVEGGARAERVVRVGGVFEQDGLGLRHEGVEGTGKIPRHLLLDGAALLLPVRLADGQAAHAQGLDAQRHGQVGGGDRVVVLRDRFSGVGVVDAAQQGACLGKLVPVQALAAAEHHVFQGVRRAGKAGGGVVRSRQVVEFRRDNGRQAVRHDDHAQPIGQCGSNNVVSEARDSRCHQGKPNRAGHQTLQAVLPLHRQSIYGACRRKCNKHGDVSAARPARQAPAGRIGFAPPGSDDGVLPAMLAPSRHAPWDQTPNERRLADPLRPDRT